MDLIISVVLNGVGKVSPCFLLAIVLKYSQRPISRQTQIGVCLFEEQITLC